MFGEHDEIENRDAVRWAELRETLLFAQLPCVEQRQVLRHALLEALCGAHLHLDREPSPGPIDGPHIDDRELVVVERLQVQVG